MLKTETKNIDKKRTRKFPLSDLGIFILNLWRFIPLIALCYTEIEGGEAVWEKNYIIY